MDSYGIHIYAVETKKLDLPDSNKESVYQRMISERNNIAAQYTADGDYQSSLIKNETDKTVKETMRRLRRSRPRARQSICRSSARPTMMSPRRIFTIMSAPWTP